MAQTIRDPGRDVPVRAECEVLVVGGGLGGVAAAVAAASAGARTILIERGTTLGGVATADMVCSVFNCLQTSAGALGTSPGAVAIVDALAVAEGFGDRWRRHKGHIIFDLETGKLVLGDLVAAAGAEVLLDVACVGAVRDGDALRGVLVETREGRESILARVVVDASADAVVAHHAGVPLNLAKNALHSLVFRLGGVDLDQFVGVFRDDPSEYPAHMDVDWTTAEALAQYDDCGTFLCPHGGGIQLTALQRAKQAGDLPETLGCQRAVDACQMHAVRRTGCVHIITGFVSFAGLDPAAMTAGTVDGRRMAAVVGEAFRKHVPGFERSFVAGTATALGVRVSRSIAGEFTFTPEMTAAGTRHPDAVGTAVGWEARVIHPGENAWAAQCLHADSFDIPLRCLLPRGLDGLIMGSGRSVSAANPWTLRVMAHTMAVGCGAGTTAAIAARRGIAPAAVETGEVRGLL